MAKTMITSPMTDKQINQAVAVMRAKLLKHRDELPSHAVQFVYGQKGWDSWFEVFQKRVELVSRMIVRHVKDIDRMRTPQQMLEDTGRVPYANPTAVEGMPRDGRDEDDVYFIPLSRSTSPAEAEETLKSFGLKRDPYAQAKVNKDDPAFADDRPNAAQWQDSEGRWCYATFGRWDDERVVGVDRDVIDWLDGWWFGGVRKTSPTS
jgi:hypothetical protein